MEMINSQNLTQIQRKVTKSKIRTFLQVFFLESHPVYDQTQGSSVVFFLLYG